MKRDTTTFGADSERLARLLAVGMESDKQEHVPPGQGNEALLRARLAGPLLNAHAVDDLQAISGRLRQELLPLAGKALGEVLLDETTDVDVLVKIKNFGKKLASRKASEAEHAVATAIYFAAIASALLFHDRKISSYTYPSLAEDFAALMDTQWMTSELARHFAKARTACNGKTK